MTLDGIDVRRNPTRQPRALRAGDDLTHGTDRSRRRPR
jgi:hypothetical protein